MNRNKLSLALTALVITLTTGCATTGATNVATFGNEYYRENVSKSKNYNELKEYLLKNNMKLGTMVAMSFSTVGGLANIGVDGQRSSFFTAENNPWLKSIMFNLVLSELSGLLLDVAGYTLSFCGDYNHASIGDNGSFGKMEYTYFLSNMTEQQRQYFLQAPALSDCSYDNFLGDVFYRKKIQVSSSPASAKLSIARKNENIPMTSPDTISLILKDMAEQAATTMLTDAEMLQALKDYKLTGSKKIAVEQPSKTTATESITAPQPSTNQSVNLDSFKTQCKELGFKVGTTDYGNCVLQLMK